MRSIDHKRQEDEAAIAASSHFVVNWFLGHARWRREDFTTLAAALARNVEVPPDTHGRRGLVYAVTPSGMTLHVE